MSDAPRLVLRAIEKHFGGVQALRGADFSAVAGEIHGLCGENGAGKSTLLKVLGGVHPHGSFRGEVAIDGQQRHLRGPQEARAAGVAIVHQELLLVPEMSVADNLFLGLEPAPSPRPPAAAPVAPSAPAGGLLSWVDPLLIEARARALLARYPLAAGLDPTALVSTLGVGLRQVVEIVRALAQDARILVLDEPTAALTEDESRRLLSLLRALAAAGTTCIYVSHRLDEIFAVCHRVTVLRDGRTVGTVATAEATPGQVVSMMVGREVTAGGPAAQPALAPGRPPALEVIDLTLVPHAQGASRPPTLSGISLQVRAGEVVAVCGAMGSGRTALLGTLFGLARGHLSGQVRIAGVPVSPTDPAAAIAAGLALLPEDRKGQGLVLGMTVAENLCLLPPPGASLLGLVDPLDELVAVRRRVAELHVRGVAADGSTEVAALSGGNQQKVALGKWLARSDDAFPVVLLLDEPTRGVDVGAREELYSLIEALCARGAAVLLASSDLQEVQRLAHRILVLRAGRLVGDLGASAPIADIVHLSTGALGTSPPPDAPPSAARSSL